MDPYDIVAIILLSTSSLITIVCIVMLILYIIYGFTHQFMNAKNKIATYFLCNSMLTMIVNVLLSLSVTICFILQMIHGISSSFMCKNMRYFRITAISLWYIGNCFPFFIYNGRLYYSFKKVKYRISWRLFMFLNVFIAILTPFCLLFEFVPFIITKDNATVKWIGFTELNIYEIIHCVLLLWLFYLFRVRIFELIAAKAQLAEISTFNLKKYQRISTFDSCECEINPEPTPAGKNAVGSYSKLSQCDDELQEIGLYINMVIKSSVLLTFVIVSKIFVMIMFFVNFLMIDTTLSASISLLVLSMDSLCESLCVFLIFKFSERYYIFCCGLTFLPSHHEMNFNDEYNGCHSLFYHCCIKYGTAYYRKHHWNPYKKANKQNPNSTLSSIQCIKYEETNEVTSNVNTHPL